MTIDASGSYRLTGNLTVDQNTTAISVTSAAAAVDLDLNGFAIVGPTTCTGAGTCTPAGNGRGISQVGSLSRLGVTHGVIRGMGLSGLVAGGHAVVKDVETMFNGSVGIGTGSDSEVTGSEVSLNGATGIAVGPNSTVSNCVANHNGSIGIDAADGVVVEHNQAVGNVAGGISVGARSVVTGNTSLSNTLFGIQAEVGSIVVENAARSNTLDGLDLFGPSGYARNVFTGNNGGDANVQVGGTGTEIGNNICGTHACP